MRSSEFGVRNEEFGVRNEEFGMLSSEFGVRNAESRGGPRGNANRILVTIGINDEVARSASWRGSTRGLSITARLLVLLRCDIFTADDS